MSANHHHHKTGGGNSQESLRTKPKYSSISPSSGQAYLTAARRYCLESLSEVVSTFCRGTLPLEMLEIPLALDKKTMLGRKSGKYHDAQGNLMSVDQSVSSWRSQLITEARRDNGQCSEKVALELLFPLSGKKARENKRQLFAAQSLTLLNNLNLLWPSEAMVLEMEKCKGLVDATNCQDLIAWENAFTKFCLDNCGNADMNVRAAEDALDSTYMKGMDLSGYIKSFRIAYNNARQCQSTYTDKRIVELFIRNLNQSSEAFFGFSRKILDSSDPLYALVTQPLEAAITYIENFHKTVIVPELAAAKRSTIQASTAIKNVKDLKHLMDVHSASGSSQGPVSVPYPILAAMIKSATNNNNNNNFTKMNNNNKDSRKRKLEPNKDEDRKRDAVVNTTAGSNKSETSTSTLGKPKVKRICFNFSKHGNCDYGDNCHFSHQKA